MDPLHRGLERVSGRMEGSNKKARGARGEIKGEVERGASRCALWLGMRGTRRFGIMNSGDVTSLGGGRTVAAAPRAVEGAVEALASIGPDGVDARRRIFTLVCASCALVDVCMWRSTQQCVYVCVGGTTIGWVAFHPHGAYTHTHRHTHRHHNPIRPLIPHTALPLHLASPSLLSSHRCRCGRSQTTRPSSRRRRTAWWWRSPTARSRCCRSCTCIGYLPRC